MKGSNSHFAGKLCNAAVVILVLCLSLVAGVLPVGQVNGQGYVALTINLGGTTNEPIANSQIALTNGGMTIVASSLQETYNLTGVPSGTCGLDELCISSGTLSANDVEFKNGYVLKLAGIELIQIESGSSAVYSLSSSTGSPGGVLQGLGGPMVYSIVACAGELLIANPDATVQMDCSATPTGLSSSTTSSTTGPTSETTIAPTPLTITTASILPAGQYGEPYVTILGAPIMLKAAGGLPPYSWSVAGTLPVFPPGLSLDSTTGVISGTPSIVGEIGFAVKVTDSNGISITKDFSMTVTPGPPAGLALVAYAENGLSPTGPFAIQATVVDSGGNPIQGAGITITLPKYVTSSDGRCANGVCTVTTDALGGISGGNIIVNATSDYASLNGQASLIVAQVSGVASFGTNNAGYVSLPYGEAITPASSANCNSPFTPKTIIPNGCIKAPTEVSFDSLTSGSQDLTDVCASPWTSATIMQNTHANCTSGSIVPGLTAACDAFNTAAETISCASLAISILSCPGIAVTGGLSTYVCDASLTISAVFPPTTCFEFLLDSIAQAVTHKPLPLIFPPASFEPSLSTALDIVESACTLGTFASASSGGNTISTVDGAATLAIPTDTITSGTIPVNIIQITVMQTNTPIPASDTVVGPIVSVNINSGQNLNGPASLTITYNSSLVPAGRTVGIFQDGNWVRLPTSTNNGKATANVTQSGDYAVLAFAQIGTNTTSTSVSAGIPVFPFQLAALVALVTIVILSYFITKRRHA